MTEILQKLVGGYIGWVVFRGNGGLRGRKFRGRAQG
jgi:hypothetical protein